MESKNIFRYWLDCLTINYVNFNGRARRMEYWGFALINGIISGILYYLSITSPGLSIIYAIFSLGTFLPGLAAAVRRMHDVGNSGWFILIPIYNLILALTSGNTGPNEYGPDPKNPSLGNEIESLGQE
jgi:uncharacterized membrane protein YhaH (DUF805 family)